MSNKEEEKKSNEEKANKMTIKKAIEFAEFSYQLEEKREESLLRQSSQMITAFSVFGLVLYAMWSMMITSNFIESGKYGLFFVLLSTLALIISLVSAIMVQWRYKYKTMKNPQEYYNFLKDPENEYKEEIDFDEGWIKLLDDMYLSKESNNDKKADLIWASIISFLVAPVLMLVLVMMVLFIEI